MAGVRKDGAGAGRAAPGAVLVISPAELAALLAHCRRELPYEACGLLGGRAGRVESVHPVPSVHPAADRFTMDPAEQLAALETIRRAECEVVGIYHSHPSGPAAPSGADREHACWPGTSTPSYPGAVQIIVSLRAPQAPEIRGYAVAARAWRRVRVVVARRRAR